MFQHTLAMLLLLSNHSLHEKEKNIKQEKKKNRLKDQSQKLQETIAHERSHNVVIPSHEWQPQQSENRIHVRP
jgi:hypothetical protein